MQCHCAECKSRACHEPRLECRPAKLEAIVNLISRFPKGDQGLVFAPNNEIVQVLEDVFNKRGVSYYSLQGHKAAATAKIIENFKTDRDPHTQSKVLILNLGSEAAAGA